MRKVAFGAIPEAADFATELPLSAGSSRSQLSKQTTGFGPQTGRLRLLRIAARGFCMRALRCAQARARSTCLWSTEP